MTEENPTELAGQTVTLTVPAKAALAHSLRTFAGSLAHALDLSFDMVEDAKMIAQEAFIYALSTKQESVVVNFFLEPDSLSMEFSLGEARPQDATKEVPLNDRLYSAPEFSLLVLNSLTDSFSIDANNKRLSVVKHAEE